MPENEEMARSAGWEASHCCGLLRLSRTAVRVDDPGLLETHSEVVQHGRLVQVAEGGEVILPHQDVGVAKRRQLGVGRVDGVETRLQAGGGCKGSASLHVTAVVMETLFEVFFSPNTHGAIFKTELQGTVPRPEVPRDLG